MCVGENFFSLICVWIIYGPHDEISTLIPASSISIVKMEIRVLYHDEISFFFFREGITQWNPSRYKSMKWREALDKFLIHGVCNQPSRPKRKHNLKWRESSA